jgi:septal ring factor EnvC (AmiA/AmiB activator)
MGSRSSDRVRPWLAACVLAALAGLPVRSAQPVPASAQGIGEAERQRLQGLEQRATERLRVLQREADHLARKQLGLLGQLRALEVTRDVAATELAKTEAALALAQSDLAITRARIDETQRAAIALRPAVHRRVVALYMAGPPLGLRQWLGSNDLVSAVRAARLLAVVTARDRRAFEQFATLRAGLSERRADLEHRTREAEALRARATAVRDEATRAAASHAALVRQVDTQRDFTARLAGELDTARTQLQQHLAGITADTAFAPRLPLAPFKGALPWPLRGWITGRFGRQVSSRFGTAVPRSGIEIAAVPGSGVRAVHDGRVAYAEAFTGFGRLVILDHGNKAFSLYGYLDDIAIRKGDVVDTGQTVGTSGASPEGRPAVYFELRIDARPVNPIEWLTR